MDDAAEIARLEEEERRLLREKLALFYPGDNLLDWMTRDDLLMVLRYRSVWASKDLRRNLARMGEPW
jgi:hypothetical protein